ncbi:hypothetical protein H0H81_000322 [Sphagnurus paluster]|uniref:Uncharacterized protein n=1 Tax=Sphagnurus paluster TaxID=117069 RepID=A0A9P7K392_9AGAR|nr:hypothetical protein H0H81_000322 [Sphagnurus paluster]
MEPDPYIVRVLSEFTKETYDLKSSSQKKIKLVLHWEIDIKEMNIFTVNEFAIGKPPVGNDGQVQVPHTNKSLVQVMGYVEKLVDIGDKIAEVHPYATTAWKILKAGQEILQGQLDRYTKVQQLWEVIAETLDFMNEANPLAKIKGLEKHVQAIVLQLYDAICFLEKYHTKSFLENLVQGTLDSATNKTLDQFIKSFDDLKSKFIHSVSVDHWKISKSIQDLIEKSQYYDLANYTWGTLK